jgi:hypothetical protein
MVLLCEQLKQRSLAALPIAGPRRIETGLKCIDGNCIMSVRTSAVAGPYPHHSDFPQCDG